MTRKETYLTNQSLSDLDYAGLIEKKNIYNDFFNQTTLIMKKAKRKGQYQVAADFRIFAQTMINTLRQIDSHIMKEVEKTKIK